MISNQCGISDGLILHHFKSKQNLYQQVLEDSARAYREQIFTSTGSGELSQEAALEMLQAVIQFWKTDETYNRMSMWSYLENRNEMVKEEIQLTAGLAEGIRQMQSRGLVDDRFSAHVLLTMAIGPIHFWMQYRQLFQESLQPGESLEEMDTVFQDQLVQLIQKLYRP
jgi:AcrR family transcriptional regulator